MAYWKRTQIGHVRADHIWVALIVLGVPGKVSGISTEW